MVMDIRLAHVDLRAEISQAVRIGSGSHRRRHRPHELCEPDRYERPVQVPDRGLEPRGKQFQQTERRETQAVD